MKTRNGTTKLSVVALAVASLLNASPVRADDEEAAALKKPTNTVELGVSNTSSSSTKFGEYNGLNKSGANVIGNVNIRGGDAYDNEGGTNRWSIIGSDLGLTSQSLGAAVSNQGRWKLGFNYDELRHNLSSGYQTPYVGSMGGNSFTMPAGFGLINTATGQPGTNSLSATQLATFHNLDIASIRKNTALNGEMALNARWSADFDFKHLEQTGAKLMGFGAAGSVGGATGETISILPMPTNYTTDTMRLGLNWMGEKAHLTMAYLGSFFRDGYDRVTFQTWAGASATQTMGTAPGNNFHQFSLTGGYALSPKTKLSGSVSYGRNTQTDAFVYDAGMMVSGPPATSYNGLVETQHADLKLSDQTTKNLALAAGIKYDLRDNKSASSIYNFYAIDGAHPANYPNTPRSYSKTKLELSGDYRLANDRHVRLDYEHESTKRWCDQYAVNAGYPAGTGCVVATGSEEDKIGGTYRAKASENVDYRVGYAVAKRVTTTDPNARVAFISTSGGVAGQNGGDYYGFYPAFTASRTQQILKANSNWQVNDKLSVGAGGRYTVDIYDSTYGEQNGNTWSLNLDANYNYSENLLVTSYLTRQHRQRQMTDTQGPSAVTATATALSRPAWATWSDTLMDDDLTFGLGVKRRGLMGGKLELTGDLTYSVANLGYNTTLNYNAATTGGLTCASAQFMTCGDLPNIFSSMTQLKFTGSYQIEKKAKVVVRYIYQQLMASDYYYNGYQYGYTPSTLMPNNQDTGAYSVNVVTVAYVYNF